MSVELNHTIVHARDNRESAEFFAKLLGLEITSEWGPFIAVGLSNGVTLDFATIPQDSITPQHYAFLVSEEEFDAAYARIRQRYRALRRPAAEAAQRDQPQRRRPRRVLHGPGGPRHGTHHRAVRRLDLVTPHAPGAAPPTRGAVSGRPLVPLVIAARRPAMPVR